MLLIGVTIDLE